MSISIETLCQPISQEEPSGASLEYEPEYLEMQTLLQPKGESVVESDGDDDEGIDWKSVQKKAASLLGKTRDLHVQVYSSIASIYTGGLLDFRDNLKVLHCYLNDFWETVHPQLDPDDDNDPMLRLNIMQMLNDFNLINHAFDNIKLVELKGMGQFGIREIELAQGKETAREGEEVTDLNIIREAFSQAGGEHIDSLIQATDECRQLLGDLDQAWKDRAGDPQGLLYDTAHSALKKLSEILFEFAPADSIAVAGEEAVAVGEGAVGATPVPVSGAISSRADVVRMLEKICEYYEANEPSSPMPMLLRRAKRLVDKSFLEILEEIVPDGLVQAKSVGGVRDE